MSTDRLTSDGSKGPQDLLPGQRLTSENGNFYLVMQDDGNVVLYNLNGKAIWSTKTDGKGDPPHKLRMQADGCPGDLALYDGAGKVHWHTKTEKHWAENPFSFVVQGDRNMVIYNSHGKAIWSSGTND